MVYMRLPLHATVNLTSAVASNESCQHVYLVPYMLNFRKEFLRHPASFRLVLL